MCTVSFVPLNGTFIFTFNRDEQPERRTPAYLNQLDTGTKTIYFTRDSKAGGSWFTCDDQGNAALLFNGAFTAHVKKGPYQKSRGLLLLDMISSGGILDQFYLAQLQHIEPFSLLLLEQKKLYRLVWDGEKKTMIQLNENQHHIFSSATLYDTQTQQLRESWLQQYMNKTENLTPQLLFDFHSNTAAGDMDNGLVIQRKNAAHTLSISQMVISDTTVQLRHRDIKTGRQYEQLILLF